MGCLPMDVASREFQVMVKPVGAACNLDCDYCYYLKKADLYPRRESSRMADDLLEQYIIQHIAAAPTEVIFFAWHGGEPTLLGVDYFRRIVALQRQHCPPGREILNGIQTNGTLIDEEWCQFLAAEKFFVGLSMDGPRELHDRHRFSKREEHTHKQVVQAWRMLRAHRVTPDVLCVLNRDNVRHPTTVYRFFKELGVEFLQFLPLVMRGDEDGVTKESVPAEAYGHFLCTVFDEWLRNDLGRIAMQFFAEAEAPYLGVEHAVCILRPTCGNVVVVEHNGDFYSCDHFVDPEHRLGNIRDTPLVELLESQRQRDFGRNKRDSLPRYCRDCEVLSFCNGGCPKDRIICTPDGEAGLNYLCAGFKRFFIHARPYLRDMAAFRRSGQPIERFMEVVRAGDIKAAPLSGRNDPCPCGSGRKFKKCCLGKSAGLRAATH
jgi:uncharacterized protein